MGHSAYSQCVSNPHHFSIRVLKIGFQPIYSVDNSNVFVDIIFIIKTSYHVNKTEDYEQTKNLYDIFVMCSHINFGLFSVNYIVF